MADLPLAHQLLRKAHSPTRAAQIYEDKVRHRPLLTQPTKPDPSAHNSRELRRQRRSAARKARNRKQKPKPLSAKEKRKFGVYDVPRGQQKYEIYERLHGLWVGYLQEILGLRDEEGRARGDALVNVGMAGPRVASADLHGAEVEVVRSRCVSRVGLRGIVIKDTKFTFEIVTRRDEVKAIPKEHTVFRIAVPRPALEPRKLEGEQEEANEETGAERKEEEGPALPPIVFDIYGSQFENRAVDRATKKFKAKDYSKLL